MGPVRAPHGRRTTEGIKASQAPPNDDQEEGNVEEYHGAGRAQPEDEGSRTEDGFALEEVLRLGGTKQDFIMLAALGDPEEMVDGGKKGAVDDFKPGELEKFIRGLGLASFPESCHMQEDAGESPWRERESQDGGNSGSAARDPKVAHGKKGEQAPHAQTAPGIKKGTEMPPVKGKATDRKAETAPLDTSKQAKKNKKKQPRQHNNVSSTSSAFKKPERQDPFLFSPRPSLLIKPGGKWYDMEYAMEVTTQPQDAVQVSSYKTLAQQLYQHEANLYKSKKDVQKGAGYAWMKTVVSSGTLADRMAAMTLLIQDAAVHTIELLESLVTLVKKKGSRRQSQMALDTLKELLLSDLLPDHRKLVAFTQHPFDKLEQISSGNKDARDRRLILWYFEHKLKHQVAEFVQVLESLTHDALLATKAHALTLVHELLCSKPEEEKALLVLLVNKLGDPQYRIATKATYLLETLVQKHPNMKGVVCYELERLLYRPNISEKAQYYGICFLNQTILSHDECDLANNLITVYFCFFRSCIKKKDVDSKMLRALLTGLNRAFPYANIGNEKVTEQLNTLFKIVYQVNFNTCVQVFMLLFQVMDSQQTVSHRYYTALYKKLLDPGLLQCSKQSMFLNLVYKSMKADVEIRRVKAFVKRLLQVTCGSMAPFICGALYLVSEILRLKPALRAMLQEQGESDDEEHFQDLEEEENGTEQAKQSESKELTKGDVVNAGAVISSASWVHLNTLKGGKSLNAYDPLNRNPMFCGADCTSLWELKKLSEHFHPSVAHFAKTILQGDCIQYTGDPLQDFTLMRFLDRFVYRNPKLQKQSENRPGGAMRPKPKLFMNNVRTLAVNSSEFLDKKETQIPVEDVFFHRFYRKVAKEKKKLRRNEFEESVEDVDDDEFEKVLDTFEGDAFGDTMSDDLDFANSVSKNPKGGKKRRGGDTGSSSDSDFGEDQDLDDEVLSLGSMDEEDFGEEIEEDGGTFVDLAGDDEDESNEAPNEKQDCKVERNTGKRKRSGSIQPEFSKHVKKGLKGDASLSAAAQEFGFLLDEHLGAKFDNIGINAMANKENASLKQLKWEADRDSWLHKKDRRKKNTFKERKFTRKYSGKRK